MTCLLPYNYQNILGFPALYHPEIHNQLVAGGFPTELARIIASQRPEDRIKTKQLFGGGREKDQKFVAKIILVLLVLIGVMAFMRTG